MPTLARPAAGRPTWPYPLIQDELEDPDPPGRERQALAAQAKRFLTLLTYYRRSPTSAAPVGHVLTAESFAIDFWPEEKSADEIVATIARWRHEGGDA